MSSPNGYITVQRALELAPADLEERDVRFLDGKVRVRALTAAQVARVKQASINLAGRNPDVAWGDMERMQFELGVIEPQFTGDQVRTLHLSCPAGEFQRVIDALDQMSGTDKEELRKAQREFHDSDDGQEVPVPAGAGPGDDRG